jgi:hypothetical protein
LWTFTIVTTDANKDFSWLHERQPVILSSDKTVCEWLDTSSKSWSHQLTQLVQPYNDPSVPLECYQVPSEVGRVGTESPTFIEPIAMRKDGIQAMFSKQKQKRVLSPSPDEDEKPAKKVKAEQDSSQDEKPVKSSPSKPLSPRKKVCPALRHHSTSS